MTDHHDFGDHDDYVDDPLPYDHGPQPDDHPYPDEQWHDEPSGAFALPAVDDQPAVETPGADDLAAVEVDQPLPAADQIEVFPPALDVDLPEPVDGFPWIDTGSLGVVDAGPPDPADTPVQPAELAAYAETELPPAADPWATLEQSDDPALAALAKWWSQN
jgi:hypothetical protein